MFSKSLEWNSWFEELREYGRQFIVDDATVSSFNLVYDQHFILKRVLGKDAPEFITNSCPLPIEHLQIFFILADSVGLIHTDGIDRHCALNIPLHNCERGMMDWFTTPLTQRLVKTETTILSIVEEEASIWPGRLQLTPTFSQTISTPTIVKTDVWHRIDNRGNGHRYMISLRFKGNPLFEETLGYNFPM